MSDAQTARFFAGAAQGPPSAPQAGGGGEAPFIRHLGDGQDVGSSGGPLSAIEAIAA